MGHVAAGRSLAKPGKQATLPDHISQAVADSSRPPPPLRNPATTFAGRADNGAVRQEVKR